MNFTKPNIIVSKCLEFDACRYDGQIILNQHIKKMKRFVKFHTVCPEVEIGLGIPRKPIKLIQTDNNMLLYQPDTKLELSKKMNVFSKKYLTNLNKVDGFILKSASPSCGISTTKIFSDKKTLEHSIKGSGLFTNNIQTIFPNHPLIEDEELENAENRKHFYTSIFTLAEFRNILSFKSFNDFHSKQKYLLMSYDQSKLDTLSNLAENPKKNKLDKVLSDYFKILLNIFSKKPKHSSYVNTFPKELN